MRMFVIIIIFFTLSFAQNEGYVDSIKVRNPKLAWKLAFIPGVGQLYNGKYLKAFGTMGIEYFFIDKFNHYKDLEKIGMRNTYAWWILGIYIWSILLQFRANFLFWGISQKHLYLYSSLEYLITNQEQLNAFREFLNPVALGFIFGLFFASQHKLFAFGGKSPKNVIIQDNIDQASALTSSSLDAR